MNSILCPLCGAGTFSPYYRDRKHDARYLRCGSCGLVMLERGKWPRDMREHYDHEYYETDFAGRRDVLPHFRARAELLMRHLPAGAAVFEIGAASGEGLQALKERGCRVSGAELSGRAVERARSLYGITLTQGTLFDAHLPTSSIDAVTMHHLLEHVEDPQALLREAHRVLKSGGILLIEVPNPASIDVLLSRRLLKSVLDFPHHLWAFPPKALRGALQGIGFNFVEMDAPPPYLFTRLLRSVRQQGAPVRASSGDTEGSARDGASPGHRPGLKQRLRALIGRMFPGMVYTIIVKKG